jgi:hypothetical protein
MNLENFSENINFILIYLSTNLKIIFQINKYKICK